MAKKNKVEKPDHETAASKDEGEYSYDVGGMIITKKQLDLYRELEALFLEAVREYCFSKAKLLHAGLDENDIKYRKILARQPQNVILVFDDGAIDYISLVTHSYSGGVINIHSEHADPYLTPTIMGKGIKVVYGSDEKGDN